MDFQQSALTSEIRNLARAFAQKTIAPLVREDEAAERFRPEWIRELGGLGLTGVTTSEDLGGAGLGLAEQAAVLEELSAVSLTYGISVAVSTLPQTILSRFGSTAQKQLWVPKLASGEIIGAFSLSEAFAGSDTRGIRAAARPVTDGYLLSGSKMWSTQADSAGVIILIAKTGPEEVSAFALPQAIPGMRMGKREAKIGMASSHTMEIILEDAQASKDHLIGQPGEGLKIALSALESGRIAIAACALGVARAALSVAIDYANQREQFGQKIAEFQGISFLLADLATELDACRLLTERAAWLKDRGLPCRMEAAMAKLRSTDAAMRITTEAVQVLGAAGLTEDFPLERLMREAKILQIVEGTSQIQRVVIAREIFRHA